jgi:hypothetical protein
MPSVYVPGVGGAEELFIENLLPMPAAQHGVLRIGRHRCVSSQDNRTKRRPEIVRCAYEIAELEITSAGRSTAG